LKGGQNISTNNVDVVGVSRVGKDTALTANSLCGGISDATVSIKRGGVVFAFGDGVSLNSDVTVLTVLSAP